MLRRALAWTPSTWAGVVGLFAIVVVAFGALAVWVGMASGWADVLWIVVVGIPLGLTAGAAWRVARAGSPSRGPTSPVS